MSSSSTSPYLGEGLLAPGVIRMFGRKFAGLALVNDEEGIDPVLNNQMALRYEIGALRAELAELKQRIQTGASGEATPAGGAAAAPSPPVDYQGDPTLARIYGFSYLGNYYKIPNPPVMRVYGPGIEVQPGLDPENTMSTLGVEFKDQDFVSEIRMWSSDHLDVTVRIDITIGWLREILLDPEMSAATNVTSGTGGGRADVVGRDSGAIGRDSGVVGRDSGVVGRDSGVVGRSR